MKILDIKVMSGPNYWSARRHKLIVMLLDLEELEERDLALIRAGYARLAEKARADLRRGQADTGVPEVG